MLGQIIRRLRRPQRSWRRLLAVLITGYVVLEALIVATRNPPVNRVLASSVAASSVSSKVFIASMHRNNEAILRSHWNAALLKLVDHFGPANVYVSIYESGSVDNTKDVLKELDRSLAESDVPRHIFLDERDQLAEVHKYPKQKEPGWIWTSRGRYELRRIPYMANLRNEVMKKLYEQKAKGVTYDTILWLNDVVFTVEDIVTLLATRGGNYDSVCSLDFNVSSIYYDSFALRDIEGNRAEPRTWPYFRATKSRNALMINEPVPVRSCWNGIIAMKSDSFYTEPPLRFRGISDDLATHHLEGSECCLVHVDNHRSEDQGVWLNPNVRVGYNPAAYAAVNPPNERWPGAVSRIWGFWTNRWGRWVARLNFETEKHRVRRKVGAWEKKSGMPKGGKHETGFDCLVNEMQVLFEAGWMHV